jgi:hypothetical protein
MDRQRIRDYLGHVAAYRASGKKAAQWAAEHGVPLRSLVSWCAHAGRWQARLDGVSSPTVAKPVGFVAAPLPETSTVKAVGSVRIELLAGTTAVTLHWPTAHTLELAAWLRAMGR